MKYDNIVGGIEYNDNVQTIISGGRENVVGESMKKTLRDRILFLKHIGRDDVKKLLSIINISRPVVFSHTEYDDGDKKVFKKSITPNTALNTLLENRLHMEPDLVVKRLVKECNLKEHVHNILTEMIQILLKRVKNKRPNMRTIKIDGDIGDILDRVKKGDEYFKIATDHKKWAVSMPDIICQLLDILKREHTQNGPWKTEYVLPAWPEIDRDIVSEMLKKSEHKCKSIHKYVKTIVLREHTLLKYLDDVENYYIDVARCIKKIIRNLIKFFGPEVSHVRDDTSFVIKD